VPVITIFARLTILPGQENLAQESLRNMAEAVKDNEPGCLMYHVTRSMVEVDDFYVYEIYRDESALQAHSETPHMLEFRSSLEQWADRTRFTITTLNDTGGFARSGFGV
jgi:quinol monooxygenase YgiN